MVIPHKSLGSAHHIGCVCCEWVSVCVPISDLGELSFHPKMTPPPHPSPCGRSVHSETTWKPHLKGLPPQYPGTLRPRDLILHWDLLKTYWWSIFFNLLNLSIFNLLSSKGIKGAQLCSQVENNISLLSQMHSRHYVTYMDGVNVTHPLLLTIAI